MTRKEQDQVTHLQDTLNRRAFLKASAHGFGAAALASLLGAEQASARPLFAQPQHPARAKRVIYLFQSGGPSQMDLFDPKPQIEKERGKELPPSVRGQQRITGMTSKQSSLPVLPSPYKFAKHGQCGMELSELLPHWGAIADDLCLIRSMHTEAINHDPAITFFQTGSQLAGRPSIGSWVSYGLGATNSNLPAYLVLTSRPSVGADQPLYSRLWSSGFLPTEHSGVKLRNTGDLVYFLDNPAGIDRAMRRDILDDVAKLNQQQHAVVGDPEITARIAQYEMAFRMQASVPELGDISGEPESVLKLYGPDVTKPGSYARNCLIARRMAERDVRFIQLFHMGWDQHTKLTTDLPRTIYAQDPGDKAGRDHHPRCFTQVLAGAGVKAGHVLGATDDYCYNITADPVHVHDLNATILHLMGMDHRKLTYKFQGRDYRLTDVHGELVKGILG